MVAAKITRTFRIRATSFGSAMLGMVWSKAGARTAFMAMVDADASAMWALRWRAGLGVLWWDMLGRNANGMPTRFP
jgi:hypothetical protein